ncbi:protein draper-like [Littorina saxatilis]|uniref:protein draper-like n=1 Tax=Littorina saxatilis TaxID=31220 RepID=UPI0038B4DBBB
MLKYGLDLGADCTDYTTYCRDGLVCDQQDRCRIEIGGPCEDQLDLCLSGGRCREGVCECNTEVAVQNGSRCEPLEKNAGGPCTGLCEDPNAICEENNATCICLPGYHIDKLDFSCKLPVGEFCHGKTISCETGTVCDVSRTCKLEVGESCQGKNRGNCKLHTVCAEGNLCRLPLGGDCSGAMKSNCDVSTVCDATGVCKKRVGSVCSTTSIMPLCVWGAKCVDSTCLCDTANTYEDSDTQICFPNKGKPGGECDPNNGSSACEDSHSACSDKKKCQCLQGYVISENSTCVLKAGQQCSEPADKCMTGTRCEGDICKPQVGMPCSLEKDVCTEGTFCDVDSKCRLTVGSDCKTQPGYCQQEAVCDNLHTCRVRESYNCNRDSDRCVAGASCDKKDLCVCNLNAARQSGSLCLPKPGRAKGPCNPQGGADNCIANAKCVSDGYCVCTGGLEINPRDYSCVDSKNNSGGSNISTIAAIIGGVLLALLCVIAFVAFIRYRLKSNDTAKDSHEFEEVRQRSKLSRAVDNLLEEEKRQTPVKKADMSSSGVEPLESGASPQTSISDSSQYSSNSTAGSAATATTFSQGSAIAHSSISESVTQPSSNE